MSDDANTTPGINLLQIHNLITEVAVMKEKFNNVDKKFEQAVGKDGWLVGRVEKLEEHNSKVGWRIVASLTAAVMSLIGFIATLLMKAIQ